MAEWIPTSERMPKKAETVLCTIEGGLGAAYDICIYTTYFDKFPWVSITSKRMRESDYVKAWMPLPEPYEGSDDNCD